MVKTWKDEQISLDPIKNETIAVIGYGIQGSAQASNMKDSGLNVIVGLNKGGKSWAKAESDGHTVFEVSEACAKADIVHVLIPDMVQAKTFKEKIASKLSEGNALSFSHAAAIHWRWIDAPENVDVIMVAPKGPGSKVRETYLDGFGTPSIVAVQQDHTGKAWDRTLGIAKAIGSARAGLIKTTFQEEVETDWFGEQADLCGGSASMVMNAFETLVAEDEDVDVVALSLLNGAHGTLFPRVVKEMKKKGIKNVLVVGGGVIPDVDKKALKKAGISEVFGPGTALSNVIDYVNAGVLKLGKK